MIRKVLSTKIIWPPVGMPIGWNEEPLRVRFHAEDTFEVRKNEVDEPTVVTERRCFFVDVPLGGEITVESEKFQCRDLDEVREHNEWERKILARGKR